jgi:cytochrome c oxidase subunit II
MLSGRATSVSIDLICEEFMKNAHTWVLAILFATLSPVCMAAGDVVQGKAAYAVCSACHGQNGEGNMAMNAPRLAGQEGWYLVRQLEAYRLGHRGTKPGDTFGMQMRPMASTVSTPAALENLVAYVGSLPVAKSSPTVKGDAVKGKAAYAVCAACHGQKAEGLEQMGGPRLTGLDDWYLQRQIQNFKKGLRGYHPEDIFGRQMSPMASTLADDAAINNVVAYINTLN